MSDEAVGTATAEATGTESSAGGSHDGESQGSFFIRPEHNRVELDKPTPPKSDAKAPAKPDKPEAEAGQGGADDKTPKGSKAADKAQKAPEQSAPQGVDERHAEMLKNQGIDPAKLSDPVVLNKLLDNYGNMHREFTKRTQADKAAEAAEKAKAALPKTAEKAAAEAKVQTPLEEFEEAFQYQLSAQLAARGVNSIDELWQKDPAAAHYFDAQYAKGRQKAWEENQAYLSQKAAADLDRQQKLIQYQSDFKQAETLMAENLAEARKNLPDLDKHFKENGVEELLKHLEDHYTIPRCFLLSDPKWVNLLAKFSAAMVGLSKMDEHDKEVIKKHTEALERKRSAELPSATGGGNDETPPSPEERKGFKSSMGSGVTL